MGLKLFALIVPPLQRDSLCPHSKVNGFKRDKLHTGQVPKKQFPNSRYQTSMRIGMGTRLLRTFGGDIFFRSCLFIQIKKMGVGVTKLQILLVNLDQKEMCVDFKTYDAHQTNTATYLKSLVTRLFVVKQKSHWLDTDRFICFYSVGLTGEYSCFSLQPDETTYMQCGKQAPPTPNAEPEPIDIIQAAFPEHFMVEHKDIITKYRLVDHVLVGAGHDHFNYE